MLKRDDSQTSIISDIVKRKRITFLKSASLFGEEEEIFGEKRHPVDISTQHKHRKLIRKHLDEKKK